MSTEHSAPEGEKADLATLETAQQIAERCRTNWGKDIRDPAIVRWLARCLAEVRNDRIETLETALTLAANRLHRLVLDQPFGSCQRIAVSEWAEEARAALKD